MWGRREGRVRRWRPVLAACAAVAVVVGAAGCDGGGSEEPSEDADTAPVTSTDGAETTTPSEVVTPPEVDMPQPSEAMSVDDRAGAAAAVEYFFALVDYGYVTGDTRALESLSGPDCESCAALLGDIQTLHESGGWSSPQLAVLSEVVVAFPEGDDPNYYVGFHLESEAGTRHEGDGSVSAAESVQTDGSADVAFASGFVINDVTFNA